MEGDKPQLHPLSLDLFQQLWGEVQAGSGSCRRAFLPGVNGLVALLILQAGFDVRRQGHLADLVQDVEEHPFVRKMDQPVAIGKDVHHFTAEKPIAKLEAAPLFGPFAGSGQGLPDVVSFVLQQEEFARGRRCPP